MTAWLLASGRSAQIRVIREGVANRIEAVCRVVRYAPKCAWL